MKPHCETYYSQHCEVYFTGKGMLVQKCLEGCFGLSMLQEAISKIHLTPNYCVADLLKMLTYSRVCSAFSSARAPA